MIDRYEIGERQTSACAMPTLVAHGAGADGLVPPEFDGLVVHTPYRTSRWDSAVVVLDLRLPRAVRAAVGAGRGRRTWSSRPRPSPAAAARRHHRPRRAEARRWSSTRWAGGGCSPTPRRSSPRTRRLSRGLEVHPPGTGSEMELWLDAGYIRAGYGWSFPARDELRVGIGSFWPGPPRQGADRQAGATTSACRPTAIRATGSPISCAAAIEDGVFFAGDSAGHCLPLTAEGIRTAIYFGLACGRELRARARGRTRPARRRWRATAPSRTRHARKFRWLLARPARHRPDQRQPRRDRRGAGLREPTALALGVQPLPRDRAAVVRRRRPRPPSAPAPTGGALLDGRLGEVGVAQHQAVVGRAHASCRRSPSG